MAHGLSFKALVEKDAICSENIKKALDINSTYDEDLKKGLSCLQKEKRSLMNSLTQKKLDFIQRKCKLPSIPRASSEAENAAMMQKKVAEFCNGVFSKNATGQRSSSLALQARPHSQPSSSEMGQFYKRPKAIDSDISFAAMQEEEDPLDDQDSDSPFVTAWLASPNEAESNDLKTRPGKGFGRAACELLPSPGVRLPPPRSPVLSRLQTPCTLDPNEGSRSLPCSPRMQRRRANTLDAPANFAASNSWANLKTALERSLSTPTTKQLTARRRAESSPLDFEVSLL